MVSCKQIDENFVTIMKKSEQNQAAIFFPWVILYDVFLFWLIYGGLGFWG